MKYQTKQDIFFFKSFKKKKNLKLFCIFHTWFIDLKNLSYRKPTWQSMTYSDYGTSDKALDGKKSRHYSDGQCTITSP